MCSFNGPIRHSGASQTLNSEGFQLNSGVPSKFEGVPTGYFGEKKNPIGPRLQYMVMKLAMVQSNYWCTEVGPFRVSICPVAMT